GRSQEILFIQQSREMKKKSWSGKLKVRYRIAGLIIVIVLLMTTIARLFTGDNSFVIVPSLFFIILLNIIARRLLP
ncbi:hypothetical protein ACSSQN_030055, partial [Raoultella planticola]